MQATNPTNRLMSADRVRAWLDQLCRDFWLEDPCDRTLTRLSIAIAEQLDKPALRSPIMDALATQLAPPPPEPIAHPGATRCQSTAIAGIVSFIGTGKVGDHYSNCAVLQGPAGSGKTYALVSAIEQAITTGAVNCDQILVAAPTHKAKQVIERGFHGRGINVPAVTTAAMLGLKEVIDEHTGEVDFAPDPYADPMIGDYEVIVVDESSMIGPRQYRLIQESLSPLFHRMIFAGDRAQLPYIEKPDPSVPNDGLSPTFTLPGWNLSEIVRYSGAISYLADDVRLNLDRPTLPDIRNWITDNTLSYLDSETWRDRAIAAFRSAAYRDNPDSYRILAWRNRTVDGYNAMIHAALHGDRAEYCAGETIVARKPCNDLFIPDSIILTNGQETIIESVAEASHPIIGLPCWELRTADGILHPLQAIALSEFNRQLDVLKANAIAAHPHERSKAWKAFYRYLRANHNVALGYALTIHKSQGSTFTNTFVDLRDIASHHSGDRSTRNRLLYTAITRASDAIAFV